MKLEKELFTYLISGVITTGVNYLLYTTLLFLQLPYLTANSIAWAGAVLTAYTLNRRWVFHSKGPVVRELSSFAGLRLITLLAENASLRILIGELHLTPIPAKLIVSIVTVTGNYVLCKFGVFKKEVECHG